MNFSLKDARIVDICPLDDESTIKGLTVPVPYDEGLRLRVLRETGLLDTDAKDPNFDRFTSLCQRLFNVRYFGLDLCIQ